MWRYQACGRFEPHHACRWTRRCRRSLMVHRIREALVRHIMSRVLVVSTSAALLLGCTEQPLGPRAVPEDASAAKAANSEPVAPSNPIAVGSGQNQIEIAWQDNSRDESRFEVHRSTSGQYGVFILLSNAAANATTYRDGGLTAGMQYCYRIRAVRSRGAITTFSPFSTAACALTAPPAASEVTATAMSSSSIAVEWTALPTSEQYFRVDRSTDGGAVWNVAATGLNGRSFFDNGTPSETAVCYRVIAFNVSGTASPSNIACATPPAAPTNLTATLIDAQTWELAWSDNSAVEDGYEVWGYAAYIQCVAEGDGYASGFSEGVYLIARLPANSTVHRTTDDPGVGPCGTHTLMVRATKGAGFSTFAGVSVIP